MSAVATSFNMVVGTTDPETLTGTSGRDKIRAKAGDDLLYGLADRDVLFGGNGNDWLSGGPGNDRLIGGRGGDTYVVSTNDGGKDVIRDKGDAPYINGYYSSNLDRLVLDGLGSLDDATHAIGFDIAGDDLILTYSDADAGRTGKVVIKGHFAGPAGAVEVISFGTGPDYHLATLSGDDYTYSVHSGADQGGEDIVLGTDGDDELYGGLGGDILFGGLGADHFMFHDEEEGNGAHDILLDFDLATDKLDYTDIKGFTFAGVSVADNAAGHAVVSTIYGSYELIDITATHVTEDIFVFA